MPNNKTMYDKGKVTVGLIIFVVLVTFPLWYNHGKAAPTPDPKLSEKAKADKECVESKSYMRKEHMQVLDVWRDSVVRSAQRVYVSTSGKEYDMSLTNTCLECHTEKAEFCDRCHNYASVSPYCWDCHIDPKEKK